MVSLPISYLHFVSFNFLFTRPISVIGRPSALKQEGETDHDQLVLQPCCLRARVCVQLFAISSSEVGGHL